MWHLTGFQLFVWIVIAATCGGRKFLLIPEHYIIGQSWDYIYKLITLVCLPFVFFALFIYVTMVPDSDQNTIADTL